MIPLLTLIAYYAPAGHRATWFALMASLMNLALVAGQLQTKYLNQIFVVGRGHYDALGPLLIIVVAIGFILPIAAIALFGPACCARLRPMGGPVAGPIDDADLLTNAQQRDVGNAAASSISRPA